jgi:hypothetical protein
MPCDESNRNSGYVSDSTCQVWYLLQHAMTMTSQQLYCIVLYCIVLCVEKRRADHRSDNHTREKSAPILL